MTRKASELARPRLGPRPSSLGPLSHVQSVRVLIAMHKPTVSLVIPMFNEELNIEHAIDAAVASLEKYTAEYEIIIVDDASTDACPSIVSRRAAVNPRIRMIHHEQN